MGVYILIWISYTYTCTRDRVYVGQRIYDRQTQNGWNLYNIHNIDDDRAYQYVERVTFFIYSVSSYIVGGGGRERCLHVFKWRLWYAGTSGGRGRWKGSFRLPINTLITIIRIFATHISYYNSRSRPSVRFLEEKLHLNSKKIYNGVCVRKHVIYAVYQISHKSCYTLCAGSAIRHDIFKVGFRTAQYIRIYQIIFLFNSLN